MRRVKKSRGGCARCKEQKRKCDEKRPACSRCVNANKTCPGYSQQIRWSTICTPDSKPVGRIAAPDGGEAVHDLPTPPSSADGNRPDEQGMTPFSWIAHTSALDGLASPSATDSLLAEFDSAAPFPELFDDIMADQHLSEELDVPSPNSLLSPSAVAEMPAVHPEDKNAVSDYGQPQTPGATSPRCVSPAPVSRELRKLFVDYYFSDIADALSCVAGHQNVFHSSVEQLWESSPPLSLTIQCMSAACLSQDCDGLIIAAKQLRAEAEFSLKHDLRSGSADSTTLLAIIMLGFSTSWFDGRDLGVDIWEASVELLRDLRTKGHISSADLQFFRGAMTYWEMLLTFAAPEDQLTTCDDSGTPVWSSITRMVPHCWTGVAEEAVRLLTRVGRLVQSKHSPRADRALFWEVGPKTLQSPLERARDIEQDLLRLRLPPESMIVDLRDKDTSTIHYQYIGEAYRACGLIRLYRAFPELLDSSESPLGTLPSFPSPGASERSSEQPSQEPPKSRADKAIWNLSRGTLKILESLPLESRTRFLQPFILEGLETELSQPLILPNGELCDEQIDLLRARRSVTCRLSALAALLPWQKRRK